MSSPSTSAPVPAHQRTPARSIPDLFTDRDWATINAATQAPAAARSEEQQHRGYLKGRLRKAAPLRARCSDSCFVTRPHATSCGMSTRRSPRGASFRIFFQALANGSGKSRLPDRLSSAALARLFSGLLRSCWVGARKKGSERTRLGAAVDSFGRIDSLPSPPLGDARSAVAGRTRRLCCRQFPVEARRRPPRPASFIRSSLLFTPGVLIRARLGRRAPQR